MPGNGRFSRGQSGNATGRPKGTPNKATLEAREFNGGWLVQANLDGGSLSDWTQHLFRRARRWW